MKRGTIEHAKMHRLATTLGIPRYAAVGIMESLWHMAATKAPTGDLSEMPTEDLAFYVGWDGDPAALIEALIEAKWLDKDDSRLLIHDWHEHAENSVKKLLARKGLKFAQPVRPMSGHGGTCLDKSGHGKDMSGHGAPALALALANANPPNPPQAGGERESVAGPEIAGVPGIGQQPQQPVKREALDAYTRFEQSFAAAFPSPDPMHPMRLRGKWADWAMANLEADPQSLDWVDERALRVIKRWADERKPRPLIWGPGTIDIALRDSQVMAQLRAGKNVPQQPQAQQTPAEPMRGAVEQSKTILSRFRELPEADKERWRGTITSKPSPRPRSAAQVEALAAARWAQQGETNG